jgi:hypothetical protein
VKKSRRIRWARHVTLMKKKLWRESTRELYQPSDGRLSAKLVPTSADRECHVVSVTAF